MDITAIDTNRQWSTGIGQRFPFPFTALDKHHLFLTKFCLQFLSHSVRVVDHR
jgi:hypothetical protein